ncbi:RidA family protein [Paenibacillus terreus]|uniref:RidA family protein n=1 Tax=Paenibacillus terreus TaxID=1387834 RepID=A0ABV5B5E7_9BACL
MTIQERLKELNIELEPASVPKFSYVPVTQTGNLLYTSGHDCRKNGELILAGKLGAELTIEQGQEAARRCVINILSSLQAYLGDLNRVKKVVKMLGFIQSAPGFKDQPYVLNGASDLLIEVFGDKGRHARSAIGTNELPFDTPVEVEIIVEIE